MTLEFYSVDDDGKLVSVSVNSMDHYCIEDGKLLSIESTDNYLVNHVIVTGEDIAVCCKILGKQVPPEAFTYSGKYANRTFKVQYLDEDSNWAFKDVNIGTGRWVFLGDDAQIIAANWEVMSPGVECRSKVVK
jgi:hypothetical protein